MNLRKFYFILTIIVTSVLFFSGIGVLYYVNNRTATASSGDQAAKSPIDDIFTPLVKNRDPFNVLLLGGDKVNKNSDTIMLANFDPVSCKATIMSIPRDTKVIIDNRIRKINYAFPHGGVDLAVKTVSELLDVNIKYYVFIDTSAFRDIVDLLGGIEYDVPADLNYDDPTQNLHIHLKKGLQLLNGAQAEQFIRFRHPNRWTKEVREYYDGSDLKRMEAQQKFLREAVRQKLNLQYLPKLNNIIGVIFKDIETNMTLSEIIKMTGYISKFNMQNLSFITMPGKPYDYSPWYYICDIDEARRITAENFKGAGSYLPVDDAAKEAYKNIIEREASDTTKNVNDRGNNTVVKNNPSNAQSTMKGSNKDVP